MPASLVQSLPPPDTLMQTSTPCGDGHAIPAGDRAHEAGVIAAALRLSVRKLGGPLEDQMIRTARV
jgi:hypothetical protein